MHFPTDHTTASTLMVCFALRRNQTLLSCVGHERMGESADYLEVRRATTSDIHRLTMLLGRNSNQCFEHSLEELQFRHSIADEWYVEQELATTQPQERGRLELTPPHPRSRYSARDPR